MVSMIPTRPTALLLAPEEKSVDTDLESARFFTEPAAHCCRYREPHRWNWYLWFFLFVAVISSRGEGRNILTEIGSGSSEHLFCRVAMESS